VDSTAPPSDSLIKRLLRTFEAEAGHSLNGPFCLTTSRSAVAERSLVRYPGQRKSSRTVSLGSSVRTVDQGKLSETVGAEYLRMEPSQSQAVSLLLISTEIIEIPCNKFLKICSFQ